MTGSWQSDPPDRAEVDLLLRHCADVDRVVPLSGAVLTGLRESSGTGYLVRRDSVGALAGIAVVPEVDPAELAVRPDLRRQGIGGSLLDAILRRVPQVWAHGDLPAAQALAASRRMAAGRTLLQLRAPLSEQTTQVSLPNSVQVRSFLPGRDEEQLLAVNARAFAWHPEQGRLDRAGLQRIFEEAWFDPLGLLLAESAGRLLGFHWTKVHAADPTPDAGDTGPIGEVYVLGVDPQSPVRGLGAPLTQAGLAHLYRVGMRAAMLYVEADNERALRLYQRLGFRLYLKDVVYHR